MPAPPAKPASHHVHRPRPGLRRWYPALGALLALLAGCSVRPAFRHPDPPVPAQFVESPAATAASAATPWPARDWWQGFGSTQLDALIQEAQANNLDLAAAAARVEEADAQSRIAGAPLLPTLTAQGQVTRERVITTGPKLQTIYSPTLDASYELDFWAKNRALSAAARATALASRDNQAAVALAVVGGTASTYFAYQALEARVAIAEQNLHSAEQILDGLQQQQRAGTITALDVAQQQAAVAALAAAVPPLREQRAQTRYALALLLGRLPGDLALTPEPLQGLARPVVQPGLPSALLQRRPDVAAAEQALIAANANVIAARAALFPSIDLGASGGFQAGELTGLIAPANRIYALTAGLVQPIFHGGALRGQLAASRARQKELLLAYRSAVLAAFGNTEAALATVRESAEHEARAIEAAERARQAFGFAQTRLAAGIVDILVVLTAENALFAAEDIAAQARNGHLQALVSLYVALGGGWTQNQASP